MPENPYQPPKEASNEAIPFHGGPAPILSIGVFIAVFAVVTVSSYFLERSYTAVDRGLLAE